MSDYAKCARKGVVEFGDDFDTKKEVLNLFKLPDQLKSSHRIYDLPGPGNRKVCFFLPDSRGWHHWRVGGEEFDRRGWRDVKFINVFCDNEKKSIEFVNQELHQPPTWYVFYKEEWKGRSFWKFYGVFELDKYSTTRFNIWGWSDEPRCYYFLTSKIGSLNIEPAVAS